MKMYLGNRRSGGTNIVIRDPRAPVDKPGTKALQSLPLRRDLFDHSLGFEWGYHGSGPSQSALAILADATGDDRLALQFAYQFKTDVIAQFPIITRHEKNWWWSQDWEISAADVMQWVAAQQRAEALLD